MLLVLPGQNRRDILTGLSHPYGITVLDQHLYWTDWGTLSVQRVDKNTALDRATIRSSLGNLMDIKAWKVIADGNAIHRPLDFHLTSWPFGERLPFQMAPHPNKERGRRKSGLQRALGLFDRNILARLGLAHFTPPGLMGLCHSISRGTPSFFKVLEHSK
jgi:hypothetical protein